MCGVANIAAVIYTQKSTLLAFSWAAYTSHKLPATYIFSLVFLPASPEQVNSCVHPCAR